MNKLLLFLALLLLCACTPQQRLARMQKRHPEIFRTDTLWHSDNIITKGFEKDTVMKALQPDTVYLKNNRLEVRYFYNHDSVFIKGKCLADTVIRQVPLIVKSTGSRETVYPHWLWVAALVLVILIIWRRR